MATLKTPLSEVALASATSADGTARNGATLATNGVRPGTLSARCTATIVTGSVVATFRWQVSADGTTFYDLKESPNTAHVAVTATGSVVIDAPPSVSGWEYCRVTATLSGATTAAGDLTLANYHYRVYGQNP